MQKGEARSVWAAVREIHERESARVPETVAELDRGMGRPARRFG